MRIFRRAGKEGEEGGEVDSVGGDVDDRKRVDDSQRGGEAASHADRKNLKRTRIVFDAMKTRLHVSLHFTVKR